MSTVIDQFDKAQKETNAVGLKLQRWCVTLIAIRIEEVERRLMDSDMSVEETQQDWWNQHGH